MKAMTVYGEVGFTVKVNGKKVKEYPFKFNRYIWAREKTKYSILCWNNTWRRMEVVLSVDGLDILNGKEACYLNPGYVIDPNSSIEIPGYRLNNESIARFTFGSNSQSYAAKTGKPNNIGVIGAVFYPERWMIINSVITTSHKSSGYYLSLDDNTTCNAVQEANYCCTQEQPNIGTVFGKQEKYETTSVNFIRDAASPTALSLYYKSRVELEAMGINLRRKRLVVARPNPFPANGCTPPPGWNR